MFWFFYLDDNLVSFPPSIKQVLEMALSLAVSSAEAERAFSVMNRLKTKVRNRMGHDLLNALMFFKMNCAKSVWEFPALDFSIKWEAAGFWLVDDPRANPSKRKRLDEFNYNEDEDEHDLVRGPRVLSGRSARF